MGKEKENISKIPKPKKELSADKVERNSEVTFQSFDVFGRTYTKSSVKWRIKDDLERIPLLKKRYAYLCEAKTFINQMDPNTHLKEELVITETIRLGMVHAYYPLKGWISEEFNKVESEKKKEEKEKEVEKQIKDSQTSFKIYENYTHLLQNMWELMKDRKSNMIDYDTKFEDFEKVFSKFEEKDIINPIHWIGYKSTLLRLFNELMKNRILKTITIDKNSNIKFTNPLDICFLKDNQGTRFLKWKSSYRHLKTRSTNNQKTIDIILQLFKTDKK